LLTAKEGFIYGLISGIFCYVILFIWTRFSPLIGIVASYFFAVLVFVSLALPVAGLFKGKEVLGTTISGAVFGFTAFYQIAYIITTIWQGNLPCL
jgi:hypothetical protein